MFALLQFALKLTSENAVNSFFKYKPKYYKYLLKLIILKILFALCLVSVFPPCSHIFCYPTAHFLEFVFSPGRDTQQNQQ